jgi:hypothetical protein
MYLDRDIAQSWWHKVLNTSYNALCQFTLSIANLDTLFSGCVKNLKLYPFLVKKAKGGGTTVISSPK